MQLRMKKKYRLTGLKARINNQDLYVKTATDEIVDILGIWTYCDRTGNVWEVWNWDRNLSNCTIDTSIYRIAPSSLYIPAQACLKMSFPRVPSHAMLYFRFWFRLEEFRFSTNGLICSGTENDRDFIIFVLNNGKMRIWLNGNSYECNTSIQTGTWYHLAILCYNGTFKMWLNGSLITSGLPWSGFRIGTLVLSFAHCYQSSNMHLQKFQVFCGVQDNGRVEYAPNYQDETRTCVVDAQFNQYYRDQGGTVWTVHGYPNIYPPSRVDIGTTWTGGRCLYCPTADDYLDTAVSKTGNVAVIACHSQGSSNWWIHYIQAASGKCKIGGYADYYWDALSGINGSGIGYCAF